MPGALLADDPLTPADTRRMQMEADLAKLEADVQGTKKRKSDLLVAIAAAKEGKEETVTLLFLLLRPWLPLNVLSYLCRNPERRSCNNFMPYRYS